MVDSGSGMVDMVDSFMVDMVDLGIMAECPHILLYLYFYLHTMNFLHLSVCCCRETKRNGRSDV